MCISDVADIFSKQFYIVETSAYSMNELYFDSSSFSYVSSMFRGFFLEYCPALVNIVGSRSTWNFLSQADRWRRL